MKLNLLKNAGKVLRFIIECAPEDNTDYINSSSNNRRGSNKLSSKQRHDMDSNGLSRSEAINNPRW